MKCICGATVPLNNQSSLCDSCLQGDDEVLYDDEPWDYILAQQELEDFEQADEYFNHYDYGDEY